MAIRISAADDGQIAVRDQPADQPAIAGLDAVIDRIEAAIEEVALFRRHRPAQPQRALRRLQRRGVDGAEQRGRGNHQRELRIHLPGQSRQERRRQEHRDQHQRDADDRREQRVHRADRGVMAGHALLDIVRGAFDHDDGVVDHDADREHDRKQGRDVDGEAERRHRRKGADDRHRHGGRRHQHRAPVLQEDQDHDEHEQAGLDQRLVDLLDRFRDEFGGVERRVVVHVLRKRLRQHRHLLLDRLLDLERVGAGRLEHADAGGRLVVEREHLAVGLRAEFDPADIAHPRDVAAAAGLDDHVLELAGVVEPAADVQRVLERLSCGRRRRADLARGDLLALLLDRGNDVLRHQPAHLQLVRIEPDPHRILAGAEHGDVADAGQPRQLVADVDGGVVGEEQAVIGRLRRRQRHEQQDRRRPLLHGDALVLHRLRQLRQRARHPVLHQHLREIQVGADLERHRQRIGAVGAAVGLHVEHVLDAVDLLLDRQRHGIDHGLGAGAGIARRHLHRRRHHIGILRDRKAEQADAADQDHQDRDDVGKDRPLDEEFRNHGRLLFGRCRRRFDLLQLRIDLLAGDRAQQPGGDDAIVGLQAAFDHAQLALQRPGPHLALLDDVFAVHDQHVASGLVAAERDVGHQQRILLLVEGHADADEKSRQQRAIGIGQHAAHRQRAGRLVEGRRA